MFIIDTIQFNEVKWCKHYHLRRWYSFILPLPLLLIYAAPVPWMVTLCLELCHTLMRHKNIRLSRSLFFMQCMIKQWEQNQNQQQLPGSVTYENENQEHPRRLEAEGLLGITTGIQADAWRIPRMSEGQGVGRVFQVGTPKTKNQLSRTVDGMKHTHSKYGLSRLLWKECEGKE